MIYIRADANRYIGIGHVMRCLSLASALSSYSAVAFVMADESVVDLIKQYGFKIIILHSEYKAMERELALWPPLTSEDTIIVDSYYVSLKYLNTLREQARVIYIDDVLSFPYPVDVLVNYNAFAEACAYKNLYASSNAIRPELVLGPSFVPLRRMFQNIPARTQANRVKNVMISTGGSDELHVTIAILQRLVDRFNEDITFHFLIGAMNSDREEIRKLASNNEHIVLHTNVVDMKSLIIGMDLCISAAGSTLYEIAACGVPLITYCLADNQIKGAEAFERLGLAINVGDLREPATIDYKAVISGQLNQSAVDQILNVADMLEKDYKLRCDMAVRQQALIDGCGADRLAREIVEFIMTDSTTLSKQVKLKS